MMKREDGILLYTETDDPGFENEHRWHWAEQDGGVLVQWMKLRNGTWEPIADAYLWERGWRALRDALNARTATRPGIPESPATPVAPAETDASREAPGGDAPLATTRPVSSVASAARIAAATASVATGDVEPHLRTEGEKAVLRPRLEELSGRLCQTQGFVLSALKDAGLTVVPLNSAAREAAPATPVAPAFECDVCHRPVAATCANITCSNFGSSVPLPATPVAATAAPGGSSSHDGYTQVCCWEARVSSGKLACPVHAPAEQGEGR